MGTSTLTAFIQIQNNIQNKHIQNFVGNILTSCRTIQVSPSLKAATVFLPCVTSPHCLAEYCLWTLDWQDMLPNDCFRSYKIQESYPAMFDLTVITQQICQSQDGHKVLSWPAYRPTLEAKSKIIVFYYAQCYVIAKLLKERMLTLLRQPVSKILLFQTTW